MRTLGYYYIVKLQLCTLGVIGYHNYRLLIISEIIPQSLCSHDDHVHMIKLSIITFPVDI